MSDPASAKDARRRRAWLAAYAAATFFSFPHPVGGFELDLGVLVSWLAPLCLLRAVEGASPGRALRIGALAGLLAHTAVLHWIYVVTVRYGHAPPAVGVVAPVLLAAYFAPFVAIFAMGSRWLDTTFEARGAASRWLWPFALAGLFAGTEWLRSFVFTGFPWATLGYAQHLNPALLPLASLVGVSGLSFVVALGAAGLYAWHRGARAPALAAFGGVLLAHAAGAVVAARTPVDGPGVAIAVLQGNVEQGVKWSPEWVDRSVDIYADLTRQAVAEGAEWVVWPETAVTSPIDVPGPVRDRLASLARETRASLVIGAVGIDPPPPGSASSYPSLHDSAFVFGPDGTLLDRYDKTHLVPFGEYLPMRALLGRFIRAVATGSAGRDVSPGEAPRALEIPRRDGSATVPAGVAICYELLFPDLVRRFVGAGGGVLLGITNDAWYGRTGAPLQFLAITAVRSAETGVWTARAANTGVSAFIDPLGRVRERTGLFERAQRVRQVPLAPAGGAATFYTTHGDVFVRTAGGLALLATLPGLWMRRARRAS